jgi:hypothetical protein
MHEALCRSSGTTLDSVHAEDGPPITQRTSGLMAAEVFSHGLVDYVSNGTEPGPRIGIQSGWKTEPTAPEPVEHPIHFLAKCVERVDRRGRVSGRCAGLVVVAARSRFTSIFVSAIFASIGWLRMRARPAFRLRARRTFAVVV